MARKSSSASTPKPVQTLVKRRSLLVPIAAVVLLVIVAGLVIWFTRDHAKEEILATVNGEPIYQSTIQSEMSRIPLEVRAQYSQDVLLNQTIDKLLILQEANRRGLVVTQEDVEAQYQELIASFGTSESELAAVLAGQNVTVPEYKAMLREALQLRLVFQDAVFKRISVPEAEVIAYYEANEAEFSAPPGGAIVSHILVNNEELAKQIIANLSKGQSFESLAQDYSTDAGSAAQGGYLGAISVESMLVPEFKDAALDLQVDEFTKEPVQSMYGYHIILREQNLESLRHVRDRIREQLLVEKQRDASQAFLQQLRDGATIIYYTERGAITKKPVAGSLDAFAVCVAEKGTLYGTSWSEFTQSQLTLFGTSAASLSYVDCDEKAHICSAANVQKYPTWIINSQQYGQQSLEELAAVTGCRLPS